MTAVIFRTWLLLSFLIVSLISARVSYSSDTISAPSESSCSVSSAEKIFRDVFRPSSAKFVVLSAEPFEAGDIRLCEVIYYFVQDEIQDSNGSVVFPGEQDVFKQVFYYTPDGKILIVGSIFFKENEKWVPHTKLLLRTININFLRRLGVEMKNLRQ